MHGEGGTHALWLVSLLGKLQILTEHRAIIRMRTVFDNLLGTAQRTLATKIGYSLLGNDDIHIVLSAIHMTAHRNDGRDTTILGGTLRGEDRNKTITLVVAGTTDTIHQLAAADVTGVLIAIDIALDGGVHSDDTQTADDLRRVGNLALTNGEMLLVVTLCIERYAKRVGIDRSESSLCKYRVTLKHITAYIKHRSAGRGRGFQCG